MPIGLNEFPSYLIKFDKLSSWHELLKLIIKLSLFLLLVSMLFPLLEKKLIVALEMTQTRNMGYFMQYYSLFISQPK
ncbi:Uncharacterised protein [Rodentibacter pneumotropicus]|uniref:Uncharacterized protein n=1 Tax=Rodentibacter pneumotropicus TaxID=758 RepID=A0A3S4TWD0_9PAST|nr:Uncharacterised protein [Rodentibacter pneumotropicus]